MALKRILLLVTAICIPALAQLRLPAVINDGMVLQRDASVPIWGWAQPYQKVDVKGSWMVLPRSARANEKGRWFVKIKSPEAGGPYSIVIQSGKEFIELKKVLSGEVWLCSGQSNMDFPLKESEKGAEAIIESNLPQIRLFKVPHTIADNPLEDTEAKWQQASPETTPDFSAIGFYYAKLLNRQLDVPVGMIQSAWGGTLAESWMRKEILATDKDFHPILERFSEKVLGYSEKFKEYETKLKEWESTEESKREEKPKAPQLRDKNSPSSLYNGMISPIIPYKIKGVIWYQGEANRRRGWQYRKLFPALIENWRKDWNQGPFSFYFVQIAPYKYPNTDKYLVPELRDAQLHTMKTVVNTGMVVTTDIGNIDDIHPKNKSTVANRLFLWAMANNYGKPNIVHSGPIYKSMTVENDKIRIMFDHLGQGLTAPYYEPIKGFEIAGEDKKFYPADAIIERNTVLVGNVEIEKPVAVRFGWDKAAQTNLSNRQGLPASPFRTDDWPAVSVEAK